MTAIELCLYVMKTQIYNDGNKRPLLYANHYLISNGIGLLAIPYNKVKEFKRNLVLYYEDKDANIIKEFLKSECFILLK